jgi:protein-disulfide isomerase
MASRAEQKAAARAAREAAHRELSVAQARRNRLLWLGGLVAAAAVAIVIVVVATRSPSQVKATIPTGAKLTAVQTVDSVLAGIPQSGNVLGYPIAPVTITEYGDLVCSTCDAFALTTEPQIIAALVKTGKAKLEYRAFESASGYNPGNAAQFINGQAAVKSAGLQDKAWNFILLDYEEQPHTIAGTDSEDVPYFTYSYIQGLASQIKGLNLVKWQSGVSASQQTNAVRGDLTSANSLGVTGTPTLFVQGPKGRVQAPVNPAVPTLSEVEGLVKQVS